MKRNTEEAIILAMMEMEEAGLPVESFESGQGFDFVFSANITPEQVEQAKEIASKYLDADWSRQ